MEFNCRSLKIKVLFGRVVTADGMHFQWWIPDFVSVELFKVKKVC